MSEPAATASGESGPVAAASKPAAPQPPLPGAGDGAPDSKLAARDQQVQQAHALLSDALRADPSNWLALYYLANVLRKLGRNEESVHRFKDLERMIDAAPPESSLGLKRTHMPEFPYVVQYHLAVALSKTNSWTDYKESIQRFSNIILAIGYDAADEVRAVLDDVMGVVPWSTGLAIDKPTRSVPPSLWFSTPDGQTTRDRLGVLCLSALAASLTFELEPPSGRPLARMKYRPEDGEPAEERTLQAAEKRKAREDRIGGIIRRIYQILSQSVNQNGAVAQYQREALAVAANANARTWIRERNSRAFELLAEAIELMPSLADAYVNLAEAYFRKDGREHLDWFLRVEELLTAALRLTPTNRKALLLLGRFYADPGIARYAEAKAALDKAGRSPQADLALAQLYGHVETSPKKAVDYLRTSLFSMFPYINDYRLVAFLEYAVQIAQSDAELEPSVVEDVRAISRRLERWKAEGFDRSGPKRGEKLIRQFEEALRERTHRAEPGPQAERPPADPPRPAPLAGATNEPVPAAPAPADAGEA